MITVEKVFQDTKEKLKKAGIPAYSLEAEAYLSHLLGWKRFQLFTKKEEPFPKEKMEEIETFVAKRKEGVPYHYLIGKKEFYRYDFTVKPGVFIPRPETELFAEFVIEWVKKNDALLGADICTGSGCLAVTVAKECPKVRVYGVEQEEIPFAVAVENAARLVEDRRVEILKGDLLGPLKERQITLDFVVSNPPYIKKTQIETLEKEVLCQPYAALDGGEDGLFFYRKITKDSMPLLKEGGLLAFEIGYDQGEEVMDIMKEAGFEKIRLLKDYAGYDRIVAGEKGKSR